MSGKTYSNGKCVPSCRIYLFIWGFTLFSIYLFIWGFTSFSTLFIRVLYCKLPTNGKQLPAFPLEAEPGTEHRPQRWEARVLPLCHRGPYLVAGGTAFWFSCLLLFGAVSWHKPHLGTNRKININSSCSLSPTLVYFCILNNTTEINLNNINLNNNSVCKLYQVGVLIMYKLYYRPLKRFY